MKTSDFNFKKHQNKHRNRQMLLRFIIYISILIFLIAFILLQKEPSVNHPNNDTIQQFEIELDSVKVED